MEGYYTPRKTAAWEQVIDKSRFIGLVFPVRTVQEANEQLELVRQEYPNARHYVYAYRLYDGGLEKSTDDGEPQGTGGKPILEPLQYRELWDVLVVVVRYFGGILLGTGGLTRAYGGTTRQLLEHAELDFIVQQVVFKVAIPYAWYETLKYQLRTKSWNYENEEFGELVDLEVYLPQAEAVLFGQWLDNFTGQQVKWTYQGTKWRTL